MLSSAIDTNLILNSAPSLMISLIGMLCTGSLFKTSVEEKELTNFPFIFQSSAILGFKGNIELSYIMHLSTKRKIIGRFKAYQSIAFTNSCLLMFKSTTIGLMVGALSLLSIALKTKIAYKFSIDVVLTALITCFSSTLLLIIFFIASLEISFVFNIDLEAFIMPVLNTINDIIVVTLLYTFAIKMLKFSQILILCITIVLCIISVLCYLISYDKHDLIPNLTIEVFFITFVLNILCGFVLDFSAPKYPMVASAFPVFAGMASSLAFIFLHKKFTSLERQEAVSMNLKITLLIVSIFISCFYIIMSLILHTSYTLPFSTGFVIMFSIQVMILFKIIDKILKILLNSQKSISSNTVPMLASISDMLASILLVAVCYLISIW